MLKENVYYVGLKQSDAEASFHNQTMDGCFAGSITSYGNNKRGNIAHNASCKIQVSKAVENFDRNDRIYTEFIHEKCREIVARDTKALFFPFDPKYADYIPKELQNRVICSNKLKTYRTLDSKFKFREIFKDKIPLIPYEYMTGQQVIDKIKSGEYPEKREVVVQLEYGAAGFGTLIINKDYFANEDFKKRTLEEIVPKTKYVVSGYIPNGTSVSIHMLVSNNEVCVLPPYVHYYKDHHKLSGVDLDLYTKIPAEQQKKAHDIAMTFGKFVQQSKEFKLRGWVHIDVLFTNDGEVYAIEANPRFGGGIGLYNRVFRSAGLESVFEFTYKAFYDKTTNFAPLLERLIPKGIYRHAKVAMKNGELVSLEEPHVNREGFDMTIIREDNTCYTHSVFELQ